MVLGIDAWVPTAEDVVVQKIRWSRIARRAKDIDDVKNVIEDQGDRLDWPYIRKWCGEHGTLALLEEVRQEALGR